MGLFYRLTNQEKRGLGHNGLPVNNYHLLGDTVELNGHNYLIDDPRKLATALLDAIDPGAGAPLVVAKTPHIGAREVKKDLGSYDPYSSDSGFDSTEGFMAGPSGINFRYLRNSDGMGLWAPAIAGEQPIRQNPMFSHGGELYHQSNGLIAPVKLSREGSPVGLDSQAIQNYHDSLRPPMMNAGFIPIPDLGNVDWGRVGKTALNLLLIGSMVGCAGAVALARDIFTPTAGDNAGSSNNNAVTPTTTRTQGPTATYTAMPTATYTAIPTATPMPQVLFRVWKDGNGNGGLNAGEPLLPGIRISASGSSCITGGDGTCSMSLRNGSHRLYVNDPSGRSAYFLPSVRDYVMIGQGLGFNVRGNTKVSVPLGDGIFTLPLKGKIVDKPLLDENGRYISPSKGEIVIDRMYDHSPGRDILWWNGVDECTPEDYLCYHVPGGTNNHGGIKYRVADFGTPVFAAAAGIVYKNGIIPHGNIKCPYIIIEHPDALKGKNLFTGYFFMSESLVKIGQRVARGDLIAKTGVQCNPYDLLHFDLRTNPNDDSSWGLLDFYEPIVDVPKGFWISDYEPLWTTEDHSGNYMNYWTLWNNPQQPP